MQDSATGKVKRRKVIDHDWDTFELTGGNIRILTIENADDLAEVLRDTIGSRMFTLQKVEHTSERCWNIIARTDECLLDQREPLALGGIRVVKEEGSSRLGLEINGHSIVLGFTTTLPDSEHLLSTGESVTQVNTSQRNLVTIGQWTYGQKTWDEYWEILLKS